MRYRRVLSSIAVSLALTSCSKNEAPADPQDQGVVGADLDQSADASPDASSMDMEDARDMLDMTTEEPPPTFSERTRSGRWLAGDFHVHATGASNDTGGDSTPERIKEVGIARGLDFVVLTDHSNSTGSDPTTRDEDPALFNMGSEFPYWDVAAMLSDADFLMVDGNEISPVTEDERGPTGHLGCYPRQLDTFMHETLVFTDRPRGSVDGANVIGQASQAGCFVTLNHPFGPASWISFDWSARRGWDAVEVWNGGGGFDSFDKQAIDAWACDLSQGIVTTAVGGSDNHRVNIEQPGTLLDPPLAQPTTYVWADALDWTEIVAGLDARRVTITDTGTPVELDAYGADGNWQGMIGDTLMPGQDLWLRVRGSISATPPTGDLDKARTLEIWRVVPGACDDRRAQNERTSPEPNMERVGEWTIEQGDSFDEAVRVSVQPGEAYFALLSQRAFRFETHQGGITNAIVIGASE